MIKCPFCGLEVSENVYPYHVESCKNKEEEKKVEDMNVQELKEFAKLKGITGYSTMNKDDLLAAIARED